MTDRPPLPRIAGRRRQHRLRVPEVTVYFWVIKGLSTAMGESTSDYLVHAMNPVLAVLLGFSGLGLALYLQFSMRRYMAWTYWFAVVMVGVFGTMAADVAHVGLGIPYVVSSVICAVVLVAVFVSWQATEGTLSIHSIDRPRREAFYWATVIATFALGTAVGDMAAYTLHLGYLRSGLLFGSVILIPAVGYRWLGLNSILAFWAAYVVTRPLGASFADWLGKPKNLSGLGLGSGRVSLVLTGLIFVLVAYLAITRKNVQHRTAPRANEAMTEPLAQPWPGPLTRPSTTPKKPRSPGEPRQRPAVPAPRATRRAWSWRAARAGPQAAR